MPAPVFDIILLIARPAAGKSEIIHYLKNTAPDEREQRFHVGALDEIDDFPMIWAWFEEDELLEQMGKPRLHTDAAGYFLWQHLWDVLIRRIGLEYSKRRRDYLASGQAVTALVEFARGTEHGGFRQAFQNLTHEVLERAAILYIDVSFAESLRKNRKRFNPDRPDSILEHGLSDEKLTRIYRNVDWHELSGGEPQGRINIQGIDVPFVVFENEDDVTSRGGAELGERLKQRLGLLWSLYSADRS